MENEATAEAIPEIRQLRVLSRNTILLAED